MGRFNKKICFISGFILLMGSLLIFSIPQEAYGFDGTDVKVKVEDFKFPHYKENGQLLLIIYGQNVKNEGILIKLQELLVDFVKEKLDKTKSVKDFRKIELYKLNETNANIEKFWKDKEHTQAFIKSNSAVINRRNEVITGEEKIIFRSPFMDIDGVGYDFDYSNQKIHIRSKVKVNLRTDNIDQNKVNGSILKPQKKEN